VAEQLLIGDVTALTGIASGRIRHYDKIGLLRAEHLSNGYRVFDVEQVLDLLRIDLMRSLGVSINDIQRLVDGAQTTLADLLDEHRTLLVRQRDRLGPSMRLPILVPPPIAGPPMSLNTFCAGWRLLTATA
jgi:DNA-binding transcriptional MerR regulator